MDPVPFTIAAAVAGALVTAVLTLWRRQVVTDKKTEDREVKAAARCEREIGAAVQRIQYLEDRAHGEQHELLAKCMDVLQLNANAFERLVDLEKIRQEGTESFRKTKEH